MSKYIIELGEDAKAIQSISITSLGNVYVDSWYVENLEELNSDYINEHFGDLQDTAYQRGLDDAWECAKKLYLNGMSKELFGRYFNAFIQEYSARQAIAKLKAYEKKQADKIGAGDVVKTYNGITFVVTKATIDGIVVGFEGEGNTCRFALSEVTKTGEHYNINEILGGLCDD